MTRSWLLPCVLALTAFAGCRFDPAPLPTPWPETIARVNTETRAALPFRLAIAPLRVEFDPASRYQGDPKRFALKPDTRALRRELVTGFDALNMFERVAGRGEEGATRSRVANLAWGEKDDLVLEIDLLDYHQAYIDHVNLGTWLVFYVGAVFPAYWVPVDRYGCQIEAQVRLRGVQGGPPLLEETYLIGADDAGVPQALRPLDREFVGILDILALWNVWSSLDESNWRAIERQVAPHAWRRFLLKVFADLESVVAAPLRDVNRREETLRKIRKRFALAVGVSHYVDPRIGSAPHAADDARRIRDLCASKAGGSLDPERDLTLLLDGRATKAAVQTALQELAERAAPSDEVLIYLAGNGASGIAPVGSFGVGAGIAPQGSSTLAALTTARGVFLTADSQSGDPWGSGLTLDELGQAVQKIRAGRLLLVVDAGFGSAEEGGRSVSLGGEPAHLSPEAVARALGLEPGRAALLSSAPAHTALALPGAQAGLLTYAFDLGVRGAADRDADGRVSLAELCDYVEREVRGRAGLEGFEQEPLLIGAAPEFGWPR